MSFVRVVAASAVILCTREALAQEPADPIRAPEPRSAPVVKRSDDTFDYETSRYEPAGFPLLGGDSDIGFEFGAVGTLSKFGHGIEPYQWNMDAVVALSVKHGPSGNLELTQQQYLWTIDIPGLLDRTVRLIPTRKNLAPVRELPRGQCGIGRYVPALCLFGSGAAY